MRSRVLAAQTAGRRGKGVRIPYGPATVMGDAGPHEATRAASAGKARFRRSSPQSGDLPGNDATEGLSGRESRVVAARAMRPALVPVSLPAKIPAYVAWPGLHALSESRAHARSDSPVPRVRLDCGDAAFATRGAGRK